MCHYERSVEYHMNIERFEPKQHLNIQTRLVERFFIDYLQVMK